MDLQEQMMFVRPAGYVLESLCLQKLHHRVKI